MGFLDSLSCEEQKLIKQAERRIEAIRTIMDEYERITGDAPKGTGYMEYYKIRMKEMGIND